jgi:hypothetical protein
MSIKDAYKPKVLVIAKLSKKGCISLTTREGYFELHKGMNERGVGPPQLKKHTTPK